MSVIFNPAPRRLQLATRYLNTIQSQTPLNSVDNSHCMNIKLTRWPQLIGIRTKQWLAKNIHVKVFHQSVGKYIELGKVWFYLGLQSRDNWSEKSFREPVLTPAPVLQNEADQIIVF